MEIWITIRFLTPLAVCPLCISRSNPETCGRRLWLAVPWVLVLDFSLNFRKLRFLPSNSFDADHHDCTPSCWIDLEQIPAPLHIFINFTLTTPFWALKSQFQLCFFFCMTSSSLWTPQDILTGSRHQNRRTTASQSKCLLFAPCTVKIVKSGHTFVKNTQLVSQHMEIMNSRVSQQEAKNLYTAKAKFRTWFDRTLKAFRVFLHEYTYGSR